jgi:hypothetical protein
MMIPRVHAWQANERGDERGRKPIKLLRLQVDDKGWRSTLAGKLKNNKVRGVTD